MNIIYAIFYAYYPFLHPMHWPYMAAVALALAVLVNGRRRPWLFAGLGGFLLGQILTTTLFAGWNLVAQFALSAAIGVALGALALIAERPVMAVASFFGVGFLAFALCAIVGVGNPWNFVAYAIAGGIAVAALFNSFDRALSVNSVLAAAGAIGATLVPWLYFVQAWNGWPAVVVATIAAVVGLVHQFREQPAAEPGGIAMGAR